MNVMDRVKSTWRRCVNTAKSLLRAPRDLEQHLLLSGRMACQQFAERKQVNNLSDVEFRVFSQWGEDGIIEWLIRRLDTNTESFIEFGVEDYRESNTRFLLNNRNWRGLVIDGSEANIQAIRHSAYYWRHDLTAVDSFITVENIDNLLVSNGFGGEIGLLSVDLDGNDYWILEAIENVRPEILICEYNALFGDLHAITVPYDPSFERFKAHYSGQYFGASILAMQQLAKEKGYSFVGTCLNGVNAFFIRDDKAGPILDLIEEPTMFPARHRDSRSENGQLNFLKRNQRLAAIAHLPVVETTESKSVSLSSLGDLYSPRWADE